MTVALNLWQSLGLALASAVAGVCLLGLTLWFIDDLQREDQIAVGGFLALIAALTIVIWVASNL